MHNNNNELSQNLFIRETRQELNQFNHEEEDEDDDDDLDDSE